MVKRNGKQKRQEEEDEPLDEAPIKSSIDYGEAARFFTENDLAVGYSDVLAYINLGLSFLEMAWAGWKLWTTFQSKYYFYELGNYLGRVVSNLVVFLSWCIFFNDTLAQRRIQAAIMLQGLERPTGLDVEVVVITVEKEPLKPQDDVFVDD